jgi:hypothetical protein
MTRDADGKLRPLGEVWDPEAAIKQTAESRRNLHSTVITSPAWSTVCQIHKRQVRRRWPLHRRINRDWRRGCLIDSVVVGCLVAEAAENGERRVLLAAGNGGDHGDSS